MRCSLALENGVPEPKQKQWQGTQWELTRGAVSGMGGEWRDETVRKTQHGLLTSDLRHKLIHCSRRSQSSRKPIWKQSQGIYWSVLCSSVFDLMERGGRKMFNPNETKATLLLEQHLPPLSLQAQPPTCIAMLSMPPDRTDPSETLSLCFSAVSRNPAGGRDQSWNRCWRFHVRLPSQTTLAARPAGWDYNDHAAPLPSPCHASW